MPETEAGASHFGAKQDPFIRITSGVGPRAVVAESTVKWGAGTTAYWTHEEVELRLSKSMLEKKDIKFEVWNENKPSADTLIADCVFTEAKHLLGLMPESKADGAALVPKLGHPFSYKLEMRPNTTRAKVTRGGDLGFSVTCELAPELPERRVAVHFSRIKGEGT